MTTKTHINRSSKGDANGSRTVNGSYYYPPSSVKVTSSSQYSHHSGEDLENFKDLQAKGQLIPFTNFIRYDTDMSVPYATATLWTEYTHFNKDQISGVGAGYEFGSLATMPHPQLESLVDVEREGMICLQRAAADFYKRPWDALTFTAELHKTVRMVSTAGQRLADWIIKANAKSEKGLSGITIREIANLDLELRYGWRVLCYDFQSIVKAIENINGAHERFKGRAGLTVAKKGSLPSSTVNQMWSSDNGRQATVARTYDLDISVRGTVVGDFSPPGRVSVNVPITAWELLTLSFVVDWFLDVGTSLAAMQLAAHSKGATVQCYGYKATATIIAKATVAKTNAGDGYWTGQTDASATGKVVVAKRTPRPNIPFLPIWNVKLDTFKLVDLAALLYQALSGRGGDALSQRR